VNSARISRRSDTRTSIATAQNTTAKTKRVNTVGISNWPANSTSMIDESPRLRRRRTSAATA